MPDETPKKDMLAEALEKGPLPGLPTPEEDEVQAAEAAAKAKDKNLGPEEQAEMLTDFNLRMD